MSDTPNQPAQSKVPYLLLGGFYTDPDYDYDPTAAQRCLTIAHELKLLGEYVSQLAAEEGEKPTEESVLSMMSTPRWFAQWLVNKKIPELKLELGSQVVGSDSYEQADIALDNANYLRSQLVQARILVVNGSSEPSIHRLFVDDDV